MAQTLDSARAPAPVLLRLLAARTSFLARLARCRSGATALEFALALPVILTLIVGMLEVAMMMFVNISVEGALREAARYGITGQAATDEERQQAILDTMERFTFGFVDMDEVEVSFMVYDSFQDVGQPEPWTDANGNGAYDEGELFTDLNDNEVWDADRGVEGIGSSGDVVRYQIEYDWALLTGYVTPLVGDNGLIHMQASITVRNEPWDITSGS
jgi:hypothetical protein